MKALTDAAVQAIESAQSALDAASTLVEYQLLVWSDLPENAKWRVRWEQALVEIETCQAKMVEAVRELETVPPARDYGPDSSSMFRSFFTRLFN